MTANVTNTVFLFLHIENLISVKLDGLKVPQNEDFFFNCGPSGKIDPFY